MRKLTSRQREVIAFIREHQAEHGYAPTIREIGEAMGIRSTNGVNDHLKALERKGWIRREALLSRSIQVVARPSGRYFIQHTERIIGNCALWWRPNSLGYTVDINHAGLYSAEEAMEIVDGSHGRMRAFPEHDVRQAAVAHVNTESLSSMRGIALEAAA